MNKTYLKHSLFLSIIILAGCKKDTSEPKQTTFSITDHFIAGTLTPKSNSYTSVYLITLLEGNKAVFISSGNNLTGEYELTKDSLIVTIKDPANYRIAKFSIDKNHKLTSAYYKALATEYKATGSLLPIEKTSQFSGKTFKGEEFKMGPVSFRKDLFYHFNESGTAYGTGLIPAEINANSNSFELIGNRAFKFKSGNTTELGFLKDKQLTVFRLSGLYYYGTYEEQ